MALCCNYNLFYYDAGNAYSRLYVSVSHTNICNFFLDTTYHFCSSFSTWFFPMHQLSSKNTTNVYFYCIIMLIRRFFSSPLAPGNVRGTQRASCEVFQRAYWSPFCMCLCFQRRGIWAAPLMMVCADGSGTKRETCTGRRRPTHLVIEGQGLFIHIHTLD